MVCNEELECPVASPLEPGPGYRCTSEPHFLLLTVELSEHFLRKLW